MYRLLRNIHLVLGVMVVLFLLMYGISAVQMAHPKWFSLKPSSGEQRVTVSPGIPEDAGTIAADLRREGIRGEVRGIKKTERGLQFEIERPGVSYEVEYFKSERQARVRSQTRGFLATLNRIHHIAGMSHGYGPVDAWGTFVVVVSTLLIAIGATGIYLWFHVHGERTIGLVLLGLNLAICLTLLFLIRTA